MSYQGNGISLYSRKELDLEARYAARGVDKRAKFIQWELRLGTAHPSLVVTFKDRQSQEKTTSVVI